MHGTPSSRAATELPRLLPHGNERTQDWHAHTGWHGSLPYRGAVGRLIADLQASGLTGRGGAAFPAGRKLAAEAVGADQAILYTHANRRNDVGRRLRQALEERRAVGVDRVPVQLAEAPPRFLSGQETALVNHLSGGPVIPTFMPPRITERGLAGAPTLVQNVETLAHLALIAR